MAGAEATFREALAVRTKSVGEKSPDVVVALNNLGEVLRQQRKLSDAENLLRQARDMGRELLGDKHPDLAISLHLLGSVLWDRGDRDGAEKLLREALAVNRKAFGDESPAVAHSLTALASMLKVRRNWVAAEPVLREALALQRKLTPNDSVKLENSAFYLAENLNQQGRHAEADPPYREVLRRRHDRLPAEDNDLLTVQSMIAGHLTDWAWSERTGPDRAGALQHALEAERLLRECLATWTRNLPPTSQAIADTRSRLGGALLAISVVDPALDAESRLTRLAEVERLMLEGAEALQQHRTDPLRFKPRACERLARLYETWETFAPNTGKAAKALEWKQKLTTSDKAPAGSKPADAPP